jgi:hypothetical protein
LINIKIFIAKLRQILFSTLLHPHIYLYYNNNFRTSLFKWRWYIKCYNFHFFVTPVCVPPFTLSLIDFVLSLGIKWKPIKYHTIGTFPKPKSKIVERDQIYTPNTQINDLSFCCLDTDTSIKSDRDKLVLWLFYI